MRTVCRVHFPGFYSHLHNGKWILGVIILGWLSFVPNKTNKSPSSSPELTWAAPQQVYINFLPSASGGKHLTVDVSLYALLK